MTSVPVLAVDIEVRLVQLSLMTVFSALLALLVLLMLLPHPLFSARLGISAHSALLQICLFLEQKEGGSVLKATTVLLDQAQKGLVIKANIVLLKVYPHLLEIVKRGIIAQEGLYRVNRLAQEGIFAV